MSILRSGLVPVDARRVDVRSGEQLGRPMVGADVEVLGPLHECAHLSAGVREQGGVYTEPCRERDPTLKFVPVLAKFRDRGTTADHGHDALVVVFERFSLDAGHLGRDVAAGPVTGLLSDTAELRQDLAVRAGYVRGVADRVNAGKVLDGQVGVHSDTAAVPDVQTGCRNDR